MISVVINTLNEEANIRPCIESVRALADEIVVCDMSSDDRTAELAEALGARVIGHERTGFVEPARHFAISQARYEWILVLDADERMTPRLASRLREVAEKGDTDVVCLWRLSWYFGGWVRHGGFFSGNFPRFFRKRVYLDSYRQDEELVHHNFRALAGQRNRLQLSSEYYILHLAYPDVEKYVVKTLGMYARVEAEQRAALGESCPWWRLFAVPVMVFIRAFVWRRGFIDGMRGFVLAVLYSVYRFTVWANLWLLRQARAAPSSDTGGVGDDEPPLPAR